MSLFSGGTRDPKRIEPTLKKLEEAWKLYPDMRLGQLIAVCAGADNIFGIEDDIMLEGINKYIDNMTKAKSQLKFHIPMYRFDGKDLVSVDYRGFEQEFTDFLKSIGVSSIYTQLIKEVVNDYEFDEKILIVGCVSTSYVIKKFTDLLVKYHGVFRHNFYIYEEDGLSHTINIINNEVTIL